MKRLSLALVLIASSVTGPPDAAACGDKSLVIGRVARRVDKAKNPASILLVLRPDARLAAAVRAMKLEATLKQAGHTVETIPAAAPLCRVVRDAALRLHPVSADQAPGSLSARGGLCLRNVAKTAAQPALRR